MELESKLSNLNEKLIQVQTNIDELISNIEEIAATKIKVCTIITGMLIFIYFMKCNFN